MHLFSEHSSLVRVLGCTWTHCSASAGERQTLSNIWSHREASWELLYQLLTCGRISCCIV